MFKSIIKSWPVLKLINILIIFYITLIKFFCIKNITFNGNSEHIIFSKQPVIILCWHSRFLSLFTFDQSKVGTFSAVTSSHKDGNFIESIMNFYGHNTIRGSSRKNALNALKSILNLKKIRLVITPDGPLGPRYKIKGSVIKVAQKFNIPIISVTYSATNSIIFKTWDRFILPIPIISKIKVVFSNNIDPSELNSHIDLEMIMVDQMIEADKACNLKVDY